MLYPSPAKRTTAVGLPGLNFTKIEIFDAIRDPAQRFKSASCFGRYKNRDFGARGAELQPLQPDFAQLAKGATKTEEDSAL